MDSSVKVIVIGGSAGCMNVLINILKSLPGKLDVPVIIVLHRLKNVVSEMDRILSFHTKDKKVVEPEDKEEIQPKGIYLAPQNYHLLVENDKSFSLDYSEAVHYSRPSIDVTFETVANVYGAGVVAILLSGANSDGSEGIKKVIENNGIAVVQDPTTADYSVMPASALTKNPEAKSYTPDQIRDYLHSLIL